MYPLLVFLSAIVASSAEGTKESAAEILYLQCQAEAAAFGTSPTKECFVFTAAPVVAITTF